ncbi:MAG: hypothetical protein RIS21_502 [Planctomycetota bacterium]|jgi:hypothetical protein
MLTSFEWFTGMLLAGGVQVFLLPLALLSGLIGFDSSPTGLLGLVCFMCFGFMVYGLLVLIHHPRRAGNFIRSWRGLLWVVGFLGYLVFIGSRSESMHLKQVKYWDSSAFDPSVWKSAHDTVGYPRQVRATMVGALARDGSILGQSTTDVFERVGAPDRRHGDLSAEFDMGSTAGRGWPSPEPRRIVMRLKFTHGICSELGLFEGASAMLSEAQR